MKPRKLKRLLQKLVVGACLFPWTIGHAAQQEELWGKTDNYASLLAQFSLTQTKAVPQGLQLPKNSLAQKNSPHVFQFVSGLVDHTQESHARYNQYYQGLAVWQKQLVFHMSPKKGNTVTGSLLRGIEQDVPNLNGKISLDAAKKIALGNNAAPKTMHAEKIIYFDEDVSSKATLAYLISYLTSTADGPSLPAFIIDANNGKIIEQWDALPRADRGQGPGGVNVDRLSYRKGNYQYGTILLGVNTLAPFPIDVNDAAGKCTVANNAFRVINLQNRTERQLGFRLPVSNMIERQFRLMPFSYACSIANNYVNATDGGFAPINDGLSPINDAAYFIQQTINMYANQYKLSSPAGAMLPIRVFTHLADFDDAFACGPSCMEESGQYGPQQIVFGNGKTQFSPLTDGDGVAHEFSHLVTEQYSNLTYANQPGGMNEAFSDMAGMAMNSYQRDTLNYTWYWDGKDWSTGTSVSKNNKPLRYFDHPSLDGHSIDNKDQFVRGMNVHLSSGVYNRMFYLLSNTTGWTLPKAFEVILNANMKYWGPGTNFIRGGCGVLQAAKDAGYNLQDVRNAFQQVKIPLDGCKLK